MNQKALTVILLAIVSTAFLFTASIAVQGQPLEGVTISTIVSGGNVVLYGYSKMSGTLTGTISTFNGAYEIHFNDTLLATGTANGYTVVASFVLPEYPAGVYAFWLTDKTTDINDDHLFSLNTIYEINPVLPEAPRYLQEGSNVQLNVTVLSGASNFSYDLEIEVAPPTEVGQNYTKIVTLTSSEKGTANMLVPFPGTGFTPAGATTVYYGTYSVYVNKTQSLAQSFFSVGFTDMKIYHRGDIVRVSAPGYQPSQVATVAVKYNDDVVFSQQVTATNQGVIATTWNVPADASVGTYSVAVTPLTTPSKLIADVELFQIPGYEIRFVAKNLASEPVNQIFIEALDRSTQVASNKTTDANGVAAINLEKGNHSVTAYWNNVKVGELQAQITGNNTYTVNCRLTNLKVTVQDENGALIPFVSLNFTYRYTTRAGQTVTNTAAGQTDLSGAYTLASTLPNIDYTVAASKYDTIFNTATVNNLPAQASYQTTILCPDQTITITTVDYNRAVLPNARVTLIEQASGVFYSVTTDSNGNVQTDVTFGRYRAEIYTSTNVLLNETTINALSDSQVTIRCVLYNLPVAVKVVDYFGNGIANVNVQISRPGMNSLTTTTQSDGTATFPTVIGGNMQVSAYLSGNQDAYLASNVQVEDATTLRLTMGNYVSLGGLLVNTTVLAAAIVIILAVLLIAIVEVYRRTGFKLSRKTKT